MKRPSTSTTETPQPGPVGATPLTRGRLDDQDRRHGRVLAAITAAGTTEVSVAAIARAAGVHRTYLYRHPDLLDLLHQTASRPPGRAEGTDEVSTASLMADLAHSRARATRAETTVRDLQARLSTLLGERVWAATGLGPDDQLARAHRELETTKQKLADVTDQLEARTQELDAARGANRELMTRMNSPQR